MVLVTLLLVAIIAALSAAIYWYLSGSKTRELIDRIPGPPALPLLGNALELGAANADGPEFLRLILRYCKDFEDKKIARLWLANLPVILLFKAETAEVVLRSNKLMEKADLYDFIHPWLGTGLLTSAGEKWRSRRKLLTPTFHFKILQDFLQVFNEQADIMIENLKKRATGAEFDIFPIITLCALDIICETAMGTGVGAQSNSESDYVKAVYKASEFLAHRFYRPWLHNDAIYNMTKPGKAFTECLQILHDFTEKVIRERKTELDKVLEDHTEFDLNDLSKFKESRDAISHDARKGRKKRLAFLDMLLYASKGDPSLDFQGIREEVDTFMFEGHDTTAAGISWAIYLIGAHPEVQAKLQREMDALFGNDNKPVSMEDINAMHYLDHVIKEALRVFPSVPIIGRHITEECIIAGYQIPKGTQAVIVPYAIHRDVEHFPDPEKFDPDRWLPEQAAKRHPYCYVPFSAGLRNCIGQKFAMMEEKVLLSSILRNFHITSCQTREELNPMGELIMRPRDGIRVKLTLRNS